MAEAYPLCTAADCEKLLSQHAIALRTDDDPSSVDDAISEGSAYVAGILAALYTPQDLAENPLMVKIARFFACCCICRRRGEGIPASWEAWEEKYDKLLMQFATGDLKLADVPQAPGGPAVSNVEYNLEQYPSGGVSRPRSSDRASPTDRVFGNARAYRGP